MDKYIAFNLYSRNEQGGHQPVVRSDDAKDVYLAADVEARIAELEKAARDARLEWAMVCSCECQACDDLFEKLRRLGP